MNNLPIKPLYPIINAGLWLAFIFFISITANAQVLSDPMYPHRLVNDFAGMLNDREKGELENKLATFEDSTTVQIFIVTVQNLSGMDIADYSHELFNKWGIGSAETDNGLLIVVKPKTATESGEVYLAVGIGMETLVSNSLAQLIIDNEILPSFRKGKTFEGLDKATTELVNLAGGKYTASTYLKQQKKKFGFPVGLFNPAIRMMAIFLPAFGLIIVGLIRSTTGRRLATGTGGTYYPYYGSRRSHSRAYRSYNSSPSHSSSSRLTGSSRSSTSSISSGGSRSSSSRGGGGGSRGGGAGGKW